MAAIKTKRRSGRASTAQKGESLLKKLAPTLQRRGVPPGSYIVVDTVSGAFVTGKTPEEASQRFQSMHPGADGWMQRFGDVIVEPEDLVVDSKSPDLDADQQSTAR